MKYNITFNETVEDRDNVTHGGVTFHKNEATEVDSNEVELSPWFLGNPSFAVEAIEDEADDHFATDDSDTASETAAVEDKEVAKLVTKRTRKKVATK